MLRACVTDEFNEVTTRSTLWGSSEQGLQVCVWDTPSGGGVVLDRVISRPNILWCFVCQACLCVSGMSRHFPLWVRHVSSFPAFVCHFVCHFGGQSNSNLVSDRPRARRRARQARAVLSRYVNTTTWCNRREATRIILIYISRNGKVHSHHGHQDPVRTI